MPDVQLEDSTYFKDQVRLVALTGYSAGSNAGLSDTDSILSAFQKIQGQISARVSASRAVNTGSGLSGGGDLSADRTLSVNITGLTAETVIDDSDVIMIYDVSASALRKMTRANFLSGLGGAAIGSALGGSPSSGSILFANASGELAEENANLFYDETNNRLGLGINTSLLAKVHAKGAAGERSFAAGGADTYPHWFSGYLGDGTEIFKIIASGDGGYLTGTNGIGIGTHANNAIVNIRGTAYSTAAAVLIDALLASKPGVVVQLVSSQTADGIQVKTSAGVEGFVVDKNCTPGIKVNSAPADADIDANQLFWWFDSTNGAAKAKFKGKSANGTVVAGEVALS